MITIDDCKAFCDAPAGQIEALAGREHLPLIQACARAQSLTEPEPPAALKEPAMMTLQARDLLPPRPGKAHPLRSYPANSPRAMARLVVLALLADGELDERELAVLDRRGAFRTLGISRADFVQVLHDFCNDVARLAESTGVYRLAPPLLRGLFAEVNDPQAKERVLNLIIAVVSSDGRFSEGERTLFVNAMDAWGVRETPPPRWQQRPSAGSANR